MSALRLCASGPPSDARTARSTGPTQKSISNFGGRRLGYEFVRQSVLEKNKILSSTARKKNYEFAVPGCGAVGLDLDSSLAEPTNQSPRRRRLKSTATAPPSPTSSSTALQCRLAQRFLCMADDSKVNDVPSVADEWDMPSLISSLYATPLLRRGLDPINLPGFGDVSNEQQGIFVSDGFVFPPSEHENLPINPEVDELNTNDDGKEGGCAESNEEWCYITPEEVDICDENLSADQTACPDSKTTEIHAKQEKDHTTCNSDIPREGWWKRKSTYIFHHIKGVTTVCSVVAAGAVVGFVVMGQRFQQDNWHLHQFHFSISSENMSRVIGLFSRLKDGLPGSQQLKSLLQTRVLPPQQLSA
ncbi:hypothetical protein EJB05_12880, partial [Eragrostis curvula]